MDRLRFSSSCRRSMAYEHMFDRGFHSNVQVIVVAAVARHGARHGCSAVVPPARTVPELLLPLAEERTAKRRHVIRWTRTRFSCGSAPGEAPFGPATFCREAAAWSSPGPISPRVCWRSTAREPTTPTGRPDTHDLLPRAPPQRGIGLYGRYAHQRRGRRRRHLPQAARSHTRARSSVRDRIGREPGRHSRGPRPHRARPGQFGRTSYSGLCRLPVRGRLVSRPVEP